MPSEFYHKNWFKANEWLIKNKAPDYVVKCIDELVKLIHTLGDRALKTESVTSISQLEQFCNDLRDTDVRDEDKQQVP